LSARCGSSSSQWSLDVWVRVSIGFEIRFELQDYGGVIIGLVAFEKTVKQSAIFWN
jgi:hypothetical protein